MIYRTFLVAAVPLGLASFSRSNRTPAFRSVSDGTKGPVRPTSAATPVGRNGREHGNNQVRERTVHCGARGRRGARDPVDRGDARRPGRAAHPWADGDPRGGAVGRRARARRRRPLGARPRQGGPALQRSGVVGQPALQPDPARLPGRRGRAHQGGRGLRRGDGRRPPRRAGPVRVEHPHQHALPDELPPDEPRRAQAGVRHGRPQPGARARAVRRRPAEQRRDAEDGRPGRVRGGSQPRAQPRCGRRARPDGRGAAVPADHRAGVRAAAAHHPAADQPLLRRRPQPGPQLRRVRREERRLDLPAQLAQPDRRAGRLEPRQLRAAGERRDRHRARGQRQRRRERDRLLRRRHHHHHAAQPPHRDR